MGLFDKLIGAREVALTPQGGLLLAAISMVAIDGDVDDDELAIIRRLDGSGATDAWEAAVKVWKTKPVEECVSLAAASMNGLLTRICGYIPALVVSQVYGTTQLPPF